MTVKKVAQNPAVYYPGITLYVFQPLLYLTLGQHNRRTPTDEVHSLVILIKEVKIVH